MGEVIRQRSMQLDNSTIILSATPVILYLHVHIIQCVPSCTAGVDYIPVNQSLFIEPQQFPMTVPLLLLPIDDDLTEPPEFVNINYTAVGRSRIQFIVSTRQLSIIDDDGKRCI